MARVNPVSELRGYASQIALQLKQTVLWETLENMAQCIYLARPKHNRHCDSLFSNVAGNCW